MTSWLAIQHTSVPAAVHAVHALRGICSNIVMPAACVCPFLQIRNLSPTPEPTMKEGTPEPQQASTVTVDQTPDLTITGEQNPNVSAFSVACANTLVTV
jgi:hypothetical protein